jgi:hypothetical protein
MFSPCPGLPSGLYGLPQTSLPYGFKNPGQEHDDGHYRRNGLQYVQPQEKPRKNMTFIIFIKAKSQAGAVYRRRSKNGNVP